jgi:hypothetical protein
MFHSNTLQENANTYNIGHIVRCQIREEKCHKLDGKLIISIAQKPVNQA